MQVDVAEGRVECAPWRIRAAVAGVEGGPPGETSRLRGGRLPPQRDSESVRRAKRLQDACVPKVSALTLKPGHTVPLCRLGIVVLVSIRIDHTFAPVQVHEYRAECLTVVFIRRAWRWFMESLAVLDRGRLALWALPLGAWLDGGIHSRDLPVQREMHILSLLLNDATMVTFMGTLRRKW